MSLANDLMIGYTPAIVYEQEVTFMELICASLARPSIVHMVYDTVSAKPHHRPVDLTHERTHDPKFKTGAKGNFVSFMMPLEKLAHELSKHQSTKRDNPTTLPRTGQDLCDAVVVTLKCLDNELDTKS